MAQIPTYEREFSFTGHSEDYPARPQRGDKLDSEFDAIALSLAATKTALAQIRRTDGALKNLSVGLDQLKPEIVLGTPTDWTTLTEYERKDVVWRNSVLYVCNTDHTSGTFATDLAAAYWTAYLDYADPLGDAQQYANAARDYRDTAGAHAASTAANLSLTVTARDAAIAAQEAAELAAAGITLPLDVTQGGHGGITAAEGRTNLSIYSKAEVDALFDGTVVKDTFACATTANITLSGEQTIDGVTTAASRVLVKDQSAPAENGGYLTGAGAWTRVADMNSWNEHVGALCVVEAGTVNADRVFLCTANAGGTLNTTAIAFEVRSSLASKALAEVAPAADKAPYFTGASAAALADTTAIGRALWALTGTPATGHVPQHNGSAWVNEPLDTYNAVINGDFEIWQAGTSFSSIADATYFADGNWRYVKNNSAVHDVSRSTDVPTVAQAGRLYTYSLLIDCTTADATVGAGEVNYVATRIEGSMFAPLAQRTMTLSFWAKHTKTGVYCVALRNSGLDRSYIAEYTINASDTWEFKTVTVTASPSAGTWDYATGVGISIDFSIACGSSSQGTANAWNSGNVLATSSQVNAADSTSNNMRFCGVRLVAGSVAKPLIQRPYAQELALARRYFWRLDAESLFMPFSGGGRFASTTQCYAPVLFPVQLRSAPTLTTSTIALIGIAGHADLASLSINMGGTQSCLLLATLASATATAGHAGVVVANNSTSAWIAFSARL